MPLTQFITSFYPKVPKLVLNAAHSLYCREHITVSLRVIGPAPFPDQWLYIHTPNVMMARVSNYVNFLPEGNNNRLTQAIAVEYFAFKHDPIWKKTDGQLLDLAKVELAKVGLLLLESISDGFVIRETESYPVYYFDYEDALEVIKEYVNSFTNIRCIGRGGMHKYNNMDDAILSGMQAAQSMLKNNDKHPWDEKDARTYLEDR